MNRRLRIRLPLNYRLVARGGETAVVVVNINNNPGITGLKTIIRYDSAVFTLDSVDSGGILGLVKGFNDPGCYIIYGEYDDPEAETTLTGVLASLNFSVTSGVPEGQYIITIEVVECLDSNLSNVESVCYSGAISLGSFILGDVDGNGKISMSDSLRLKQHLAGNPVIITERNADLNSDGSISMADSLLLRRHLAGNNVNIGIEPEKTSLSFNNGDESYDVQGIRTGIPMYVMIDESTSSVSATSPDGPVLIKNVSPGLYEIELSSNGYTITVKPMQKVTSVSGVDPIIIYDVDDLGSVLKNAVMVTLSDGSMTILPVKWDVDDSSITIGTITVEGTVSFNGYERAPGVGDGVSVEVTVLKTNVITYMDGKDVLGTVHYYGDKLLGPVPELPDKSSEGISTTWTEHVLDGTDFTISVITDYIEYTATFVKVTVVNGVEHFQKIAEITYTMAEKYLEIPDVPYGGEYPEERYFGHWDKTEPVVGGFTSTAIFDERFNVSIVYNNGNESSYISVINGNTIPKSMVVEPQRDGYIFSGWYKDIRCTELWNFDNDTVTDTMSLYAGWKAIEDHMSQLEIFNDYDNRLVTSGNNTIVLHIGTVNNILYSLQKSVSIPTGTEYEFSCTISEGLRDSISDSLVTSATRSTGISDKLGGSVEIGAGVEVSAEAKYNVGFASATATATATASVKESLYNEITGTKEYVSASEHANQRMTEESFEKTVTETFKIYGVDGIWFTWALISNLYIYEAIEVEWDGNEFKVKSIEYLFVYTEPQLKLFKSATLDAGHTNSLVAGEYENIDDQCFMSAEDVLDQVNKHFFVASFYADNELVCNEPINDCFDEFIIPEIPEKEGYVGEWEEFSKPKTHIRIDAIYTPIEYNVTFKDGNDIVKKSIFTMENPIESFTPTSERYDFIGWSLDGVLTDPTTYRKAQDVQFEAVWDIPGYTVRYTVDGAEYSVSKVMDLCNPAVPKDPIKEHYVFNGWLLDGVEVDPGSLQVERDMTLVASFSLEPGLTPIYSSFDLQKIANNLNGDYILMNDIITSNFTPIGNKASSSSGTLNSFGGTFYGQGHKITYSTSMTPSVVNARSSLGLFSSTTVGSVIQDLVVDASFNNITYNSNYGEQFLGIGSIVGVSNGGTIKNCDAKMYLSMTDHRNKWLRTCAGGIVGLTNSNTTYVIDCVTDCSITAYGLWTFAGGVVGHALNSTASITHCLYKNGYINAFGGLNWFNGWSERASAGGIIGCTEGSGTFIIDRCGSIGIVYSHGRYSDSGGVIGLEQVGKGKITNCVYAKGRYYEGGNLSPDVTISWGNVSQSNAYAVDSSKAVESTFMGYSHGDGCAFR